MLQPHAAALCKVTHLVLCRLAAHFVQTNHRSGLTDADVQSVLGILGGASASKSSETHFQRDLALLMSNQPEG